MIRFITILFLALAPGYSSSAPLVNTKVGTIKGSEEISRKGEQYYSFRGIRYAKAPTGELRFKAPVPVEPSNKTIDATQDGPVCYQPDTLHLGFDKESEDCLWVNVYTRHIGDSDKLRPVLVYIHGGAFVSFTGQSKYHGPDYLLDHDIVVVTVNYRLGTLGFFSTGDKNAPGNYGMKDQVEALRWVRDNIKAFGGDPDRVTIAGESAGGASVGLHMLSPMSRGLFHGAMILSGSANNNWAVDKNPIKLAEKQARLLNCPTESTEEMVECIKKISPQRFSEIYPKLKEWNDHPVVVISPVIEWDDNNGEERFLVKHPLQSFAQRDVADVPVFIGTTRDEFANFADAIVQNKELAAEMSANWTTIAPIAFTYEPNDHISNELRNFYLGSEDQPIKNDPEIRTKLGQLFADSVIIFGVVRSAKLLAATNSAPVYLYQFNFQGKYSGDGVYHSSEMDYLFFNSLNHTRFDTEGEDAQCVDRLTSLWKNFVETGNPTPEPEEVLKKVIWTPYTDENPAYLDINKNLTVVEGLYFEQRMSFWESLFPLSNGRTRSGMTRAGGKGNRAESGGSGGRNRWWWWFG